MYNTEDILRLAICSDLRKNTLISLIERKKSLADLREEMDISSTTAIHALKELEKGNLTYQDKNRDYSLTNTGRIVALKLLDFSETADTLKNHEKFWFEHDLRGIPEHMMEKIGWLSDSVLVTDSETDIIKVHSNFINLLRDAKEIRGVSSIFIPEFSSLFEDLILKKKVDVHLVLKKEVQEKIDKEILKKIFSIKDSKFNLYVLEENIKAAFTVTDYFFSIGFVRMDGTYDYSNDLISYSKKAIAWGYELFEYYVKLSKRVTSS